MTLRCDVAVVGGGPAGVAAACSAAESGASTVLVEPCAELGGNVSQAFVHTICGLYLEGETPAPTNPGFPMRFHAALRACSAAGVPERVGRVWVVPLQPGGFAAQAARTLAEAGAGLRRIEGAVVAAQLARAPGALNGLRLRVSGGAAAREETLEAGAVVDASGDGVLGPLAGADHDRAPAAELQACSYIFGLSGVPARATEGFARMQLTAAIGRACAEGALAPGTESVLIRPGTRPGDAFVTLGLPALEGRAFDPLDPAYRARALEDARERADQVVAYLRAEREGFAACEIARSPARIGVREGRRLLGVCVLSREDVLEGRRHPDEVARSSWPIELWGDHRGARYQYPERACSIPLGALASRSHATLAMAGRCLSASHEALGAVRVIGTALATGAAAGRAAALAAASGVAIASVAPEQVRSAALGDAGAER